MGHSGYPRMIRRSLRRNDPLVRRSDRIEALLVLALTALALLLVPLAVWIGERTADSQVALADRQTAEYSTVTATTVADTSIDSVPTFDSTITSPTAVPAKWVWGDEVRRGDVIVDQGTRAGTDTTIWVDTHGNPVGSPLNRANATFAAVLTGLFVWVGTMSLAVSGQLLVRWRLHRARSAEWDRELRLFLRSASRH